MHLGIFCLLHITWFIMLISVLMLISLFPKSSDQYENLPPPQEAHPTRVKNQKAVFYALYSYWIYSDPWHPWPPQLPLKVKRPSRPCPQLTQPMKPVTKWKEDRNIHQFSQPCLSDQMFSWGALCFPAYRSLMKLISLCFLYDCQNVNKNSGFI